MDPRKDSRLFRNLSVEEQDLLARIPSTLNFHERGIPVSHFEKYPKLNEFFTVVATSRMPGEDFDIVAAIEAKHYPFYGM